MKSLPLILTFPVLLPICAQAATPLDRDDGRLRLQDGGRSRLFRVAKDELHRSKTNGDFQSLQLRGKRFVREVVSEAKSLENQTGDPVDLVAYEEGVPQTEANRRLITRRVLVKLAEGVDPVMVMEATGATAYNPLDFSPGNYQYFYSDADTALEVAELLRSVDGVLSAEVLLAKKLYSKTIPTDPYFSYNPDKPTGNGVPESILPIHPDLVYDDPLAIPYPMPVLYQPGEVRPYQWYLNNTGYQFEHSMASTVVSEENRNWMKVKGKTVGNTLSTYDDEGDPMPPPPDFRIGDAVVLRNFTGGEGLIDDEKTIYYIASRPTHTTFTLSTSGRPGGNVNFRTDITQGEVGLWARNPMKVFTFWDGQPGNVLFDPVTGETIRNIKEWEARTGRPASELELSEETYYNGEDLGDKLVDINVTPVWGMKKSNGDPFEDDPGLFGNQITVAVIDQGVYTKHPEFNVSLVRKLDNLNFLVPSTDSNRNNPIPRMKEDNHGTACAGLIFAKHDGTGIAGIAPKSAMVAIRLIGGYVTPVETAQAMIHGANIIFDDQGNPRPPVNGTISFQVASNSWGPGSFGSGLYDDEPIFKDALKFGVSKNVVYVFAAGNDGDYHDNANYSYTANSPYTLTVGGVTDIGRRVGYSNPGAAVGLVAPTAGDELPPIITHPDKSLTSLSSTTERPNDGKGLYPRYPYRTVDPEDVPVNKRRATQGILTLDNPNGKDPFTATDGIPRYNSNFNGTSASTPLVSGAAALVLEAGNSVQKKLGWRDVHEILMRSAYPIDDRTPWDDPAAPNGLRGFGEWVRGPLGNYVSHIYGYGCLDVHKAVRMAKEWYPMPTQEIRESKGPSNLTILDNFVDVPLRQFQPPPTNFRVEAVQVRVRIQHGRRGDLGISLISPAMGQSGVPIESKLYEPHREDYGADFGNPDTTLTPSQLDLDRDYWTFTTVRNWGGVMTEGNYYLKIWDNTNMPANFNKPFKKDNPVYCPVGNPSGAGRLVESRIVYYGHALSALNEPPFITNNGFTATLNQPYNQRIAVNDERLPQQRTIENYTLRFVRPVGDTTAPHPNATGPDAVPVRVNPLTGELGYSEKYLSGPDRPEIAGSWIVEISATSVLGTTTKQMSFTVEEDLTYLQWKNLNFTQQQRQNPSISGDQADPDLDGVPNVLEFAMGTNPWAIQNPEIPSTIIEPDGTLVIRYRRDSAARNASVGLETSEDLQTWVELAPTATVKEGNYDLYELRVPKAEAGKKFFRLRGTAN